MTSSPERREYIDWARGLAVLIMIEAHALDSWTRSADRESIAFRNLTVLGGFAAPLFLWLAGMSAVFAAERTAARTTRITAVRAGVLRGLQIFALAFLFRLQGFVVSPGGTPLRLLRVDILNIMGPTLVAAAIVWGIAAGRRRAILLAGLAAAAIALTTPLVRAAHWVDALPFVAQWYVRPAGENTTFTLFPWAGFVFAGAALGGVLSGTSGRREARAVTITALLGAVSLLGGLWAAGRPPLFAGASFWTSSPTYFFVRVGVLMLTLAAFYALRQLATLVPSAFTVMSRFGRSSLFVYWIHVELVYGYATWAMHHRLSIPLLVVAYGAFCGLMLAAIRLRDQLLELRARRVNNPLDLWYLGVGSKNR